MKVEDLMIEDWLLYKSDSNAFPIQITREMFNKELVVWNDRFEPIQLTPEILKKNGFVNSYIDLSLNKDSVYKYNNFYTGNSVIVDMESNKLIVKYENDIWMNLPYNRTIYVHELQHVLKHCDIKKEIII
jgi:hypothetical protein